MMRKEQLLEDDIFVIHDFLCPDECRQLITVAESTGFADAPITTAIGPIIRKDVRNNDRVMIDDSTLANQLFGRALPFLPERVGRWKPCGLNERFRHYRYSPGQKFDWHFDGAFFRDNGEMSKLTFMIYLNDGCQGGQTAFNLRQQGALQENDAFLRVQPARGTALVFRHNLLHTGEVVTEGVKYVMRSDVMCRILV